MYKKQTKLVPVGHGTLYYGGGPTYELTPLNFTVGSECITFDHPNRKLGEGDVGGPFYAASAWLTPSDEEVEVVGLGRWYKGTLNCEPNSWGGQGFSMSPPEKPGNFDSLVSAGATAIARTTPTNPISGAATAIGEAREGFPRFVGSTLLRRTHPLRNIGDEYLNVEFGWKPMMMDLRNFAKAVKSSNKTIRQLHRDSGASKSVRRKYYFPIETSETVVWPDPVYGDTHPKLCTGEPLDAWMAATGPQPQGYTKRYTTKTRTWFSGAFSYVLPDAPKGFMDKLDMWDAEANKLLGTRLTPSVVWELTPWSWAADWFTNTGDVLSNISAFGADGLVLKYGYVMREIVSSGHVTWSGYLNQHQGAPRYVTIHESCGSTQKVRLRATPFGFGTELADLSARQVAIGAAVGMTRAPRLSL